MRAALDSPQSPLTDMGVTMGDGSQFFEMLVLLALAIFFISRLRKVLGKHIDDDVKKPGARPRNTTMPRGQVVNLRDARSPEAIDAAVHQVEDDAPLLADIDDPDVSKGLGDIKAADPAFNVREFLNGAKMAFEMILEAYNNGDKALLKDLLSKEIYTDFENAIEARKTADTHEESTLLSVESADITRAKLRGKTAEVTVTFVSEQVTVERDKNGEIVAGDPSQAELVTDEWTFTRETRSQNPNWILADT